MIQANKKQFNEFKLNEHKYFLIYHYIDNLAISQNEICHVLKTVVANQQITWIR